MTTFPLCRTPKTVVACIFDIRSPSISLSQYCLRNDPMIALSPGACLREAASAKAGERAGVRGRILSPPLPSSSTFKGEEVIRKNLCQNHPLIILFTFLTHIFKTTGMGFVIDLHQFPHAHVGISLGRRETRVSQHFLNLSDISPRIQEMRGKCVAQAMRTDFSENARMSRILLNQSSHGPCR